MKYKSKDWFLATRKSRESTNSLYANKYHILCVYLVVSSMSSVAISRLEQALLWAMNLQEKLSKLEVQWKR